MVFWGELVGKRVPAQRRFGIPGSCSTLRGRRDISTLVPHPEDVSQPHCNFETPPRDHWVEKGTDRRCLLKLLRSQPTALVSDQPPGLQGELRVSTLLEGKRCAI